MTINKIRNIKIALDKLAKINKALSRLDVHACNYGNTESQDKKTERLEKEANTIAETIGCITYHQGDPRGWSLYLIDKTEKEPDQNYMHGLPV